MGRRLNNERKMAVKQMKDAGKSIHEIGQVFGISRQRIYQIMKEVHSSSLLPTELSTHPSE